MMGIERLEVPAFVACRRDGLGLSGSFAPFAFATALHGHGHDDELFQNSNNMKCLPTQDGSTKKRRASPTSLKKRLDSILTPMTLLCAVTVLLGTPSFDGINIPGDTTMNCKASAIEPASKDESWPATSSDALTDQLFKSMSTRRENTKDSASSMPRNKQRYWDSMKGTTDEIMAANEHLIDHAVATVSTMYYDSSGGFNFDAQEFYAKWKKFRYSALHRHEGIRERKNFDNFDLLVVNGFDTRDNAVKTLKSIVSSLNDPYSKYLTREELRKELEGEYDGFLGLGALVEASTPQSSSPLAMELETKKSIRPWSPSREDFNKAVSRPLQGGVSLEASTSFNEQLSVPKSSRNSISVALVNHGRTSTKNSVLSVAQAAKLPVITAIVPDSPAERAGLVVGDRIASVGEYQFTGMSHSQVQKALNQHFRAENYFGRADLTVAKKVFASTELDRDNAHYDENGNIVEEKYVFENGWYQPKISRYGKFDNMPSEQVLGYKLSHVKSISTTITSKQDRSVAPIDTTNLETIKQSKFPTVVGGDNIVHYELLTPNDSIFQHMANPEDSHLVGYIRFTRFSKASTAGYINAINSLEEAGAQSYIIDLRNNYGGVIQEAMLTASSLLRDPHSVLCYTLNSRGGFKPQENMEYIVDEKYPGYLLSSESIEISRDQVRREHPEYLEDGGWSSPTSYASLKELRMTRGIKPAYNKNAVEELERRMTLLDSKEVDLEKLADVLSRHSQKKIVLLINEGTASAAEVFASALHDNGRTVLVGTKTFGKGLIQHTFAMPDGGGLRLTVAEYLTPSLQHVTKVGGAKFDSGIKPDVRCESNQGIPQNVGADLCVGLALDVLESEGG